ncbi:cobyric acid synthase [Agilicoccus flavus]|uniref:cobyric acid synthase n=1 Tax=Agilicoccus flavus TaxID=2775968 RepID=UPI001CF612F6|nr:cobyric acid synthase [Agilicoccus flavus]
MRGLLVGGTTSDAGKSLLTAGLCRWLARDGVDVAPFKAQNMSNNSMVCADGAEIGRAQWLQAQAARVVPEAAMNPVLLKPGSDRRSHVVLLGRPAGHLHSREWSTGRRELAAAAFAAVEELAGRHEVVVAEGAGSIAEVNLREGDFANLGLARATGLPVVVVGDIDRGGVLASMYGSWALLPEDDRACLAGWIVNKFRGALDLLTPGLDVVRTRTGLPMLGVVPWLEDAWLDGEDALALGAWGDRDLDDLDDLDDPDRRDDSDGPVGNAGSAGTRSGAAGIDPLRVAVVGFPRLSNATDVDALAAEPGVEVVVTRRPGDLAGADLVVLPGSRATASDLAWLRSRGLAQALTRRAADGGPIVGICGGYQMLARCIRDDAGVEIPGGGAVDGLGLLPVDVTFHAQKRLGTPVGSWEGHRVEAYEIHHGVARRCEPGPTGEPGGVPALGASPTGEVRPFLDGWSAGAVWGTTWHGAFENDGFRRAFLAQVADRRRLPWRARTGAPGFRARRETMLEHLADAVEGHLDTGELRRLMRI